MLMLGQLEGLRACEIACLHTRDQIKLRRPAPTADDGAKQSQVSVAYIRVTGKGSKERLVPLHPVVSDYMDLFEEGYFFPSPYSPTGHMLPASIGRRIRKLMNDSGWNAHSLRHKFATDVYQGSGDILAVKDLLGHASVATTQIYARADSSRLADYVADLPLVSGLEAKKNELATTP